MTKHIQTWILITLLALFANGVVSAKLASGHQNLSGNLHQSQTVLKALLHQGLEEVSTMNVSGSPLATKGGTRVGDLKPIDGPAHQAPRPGLQRLSDDELLDAARNPRNGDALTRNTRTGTLSDGNGRAVELQRRAADPNSRITNDTVVPVNDRTPDMSMFPDL